MTEDNSFATADGGLSLNPEIDIAVRISASISKIWFSSYNNLRSFSLIFCIPLLFVLGLDFSHLKIDFGKNFYLFQFLTYYLINDIRSSHGNYTI